MKALWAKIIGVFKTYAWAKWVALGVAFAAVGTTAVVTVASIEPKPEDSSVSSSIESSSSIQKDSSVIVSSSDGDSDSSIEEHVHNYIEEITKAPSCTNKGKATYTCECGDSYEEILGYLSHDYKDGYCIVCNVVDPNFGSAEDSSSQSSVTSSSEEESSSEESSSEEESSIEDSSSEDSSSDIEHEHNYVEERIEEPTCIRRGKVTYTCECGDSYMEEIGYIAHNYYGEFCDVCGAIDPNHSYVERVIKAPTCTDKGIMTYECPCGESYNEIMSELGHTTITIEAQEPTCTSIGWEEYEVCACGYTTYVEIAALGHNFVDGLCTVCESKDHVHEWDDGVISVQPTCIDKGTKVFTCWCKGTRTESVDALGHDLYTVNEKKPTCTTDGWSEHDLCYRCDYSTKIVVEALGHDWVKTDETPATCTESGWTAFEKCTRCHEYKDDYKGEVIPAFGHTEGKPTCTEGVICGNCNQEIIPALGHTGGKQTCTSGAVCEVCYKEYLPALGHEGGAATCTVGAICTRCKTVYTEPAGHNWVATEQVDPDCENTGWTAFEQCSSCNVYKDNNSGKLIAALGHTGGERTCTEGATCTRCSKVYNDPYGHQYTYYQEVEATCTKTGWTAYKRCSRCNEYENDYAGEEIAALGHIGDATCTETAVCTRCEKTYGPLGHDWLKTDEAPATCTESGWTAFEQCERCHEYKDGYKGETIEALGHTGGEETCYNGKICTRCSVEYTTALGHTGGSATCTDGKICTRCGSEYTDALGHDWIAYEEDPATCMGSGWTAYEQCDRCGEYKNSYEGEEIPALGHTGGEETCTHGKLCERCGVEYTEALGHDFLSVTCDKVTRCERCQLYISIGHNFVDGECTICGKKED